MNDNRRPPQPTPALNASPAVRYPVQLRATFVRLPRQPSGAAGRRD